MATKYIMFPIDTAQQELVQSAYDYLKARFPGWDPATGNLDAAMLESWSHEASQLRVLASDVPTSIFRAYGNTVMGVPPTDASPATVSTTWTVVDTAGYTIPDGTIVGFRNSQGTLFTFRVMGDVDVAAGSTVTATGGVVLAATEPGSDSSGLGGAAQTMELVDPFTWVVSIVMTGATSGGVDAETDDEYLDRLVGETRLLSRVLVIPKDFETAARSHAGVYRAMAIDGYNPGDDTYNNERMIAVAVMDESGASLSSPVKSALASELELRREVNFVVNVIDPTITTVDVQFDVKPLPGTVSADVKSASEAAVTDYLRKTNWGRRSTTDLREWVYMDKVRYLKLVQIAENAPGVDYIGQLQLKTTGAFVALDITIDGPAPTTTPGTILGTVI